MSMSRATPWLLAPNPALVGMWVRLLRVPYDVLFPLILLFCAVGVRSVNNSRTDVYLMRGSARSATPGPRDRASSDAGCRR
jgi:TctA family transporter